MNLEWALLLAVVVAVVLYALYTVYNLTDFLDDALRSP